MEKSKDIQPPRWAQRFLQWYCRPELLEDLEGDLHEYFLRNLKSKGPQKAKLIYIVDVIKFLRSYTIRKPQPATSMNNLTVLQNYFKTSVRTIYRNKLFSGINIIGLAVSMSVGLLLIAFLAELKSYDRFHENYDRIYRVMNNSKSLKWDGDGNDFASTSVLAARRIQESVSGIEAVTILQSNFDKDLHVGEKTVPIKGMFADEGFFKVFTWEFLGGNPATALKDLNSLVLTETSAVSLFGTADVVGKQVVVDTANYTITAVLKDPPKHSHLQFGMIASFITLDTKRLADQNKEWMKWDNMWQQYVYIVIAPQTDLTSIKESFTKISEEENKALENQSITMHPQPLSEVVLGPDLSNQIGPNLNKMVVWILGALAIIVILSACFNYTNLSIARALRRTREVGIRKVVGATRQQVFTQFVVEAVVISVLAMSISFLLFLLIRPGFLASDRNFNELVTLQPTLLTYLYFVLMAIGVGVLAGMMPAFFFSKTNTAQVLKDLSSVKLFRHITLRKGLIVFQYTLSLALIAAVNLAYLQYKFSLAFDLGLTTENILNVDLQFNKADVVMKSFGELPEVKQMSMSMYVTSVGTSWSGNIRYKDPHDSTIFYYNHVDTAYISLHKLKLIAGRNFEFMPSGNVKDAGVILNQKAIKWMGIQDPHDAIGEEVYLDGNKTTIIGVVQDFYHNTLNNALDNFALRYYGNIPARWGGVVNLNVQSNDLPAFMAKLEAAWKKVDPIHPIQAEFYKEKIAKSYAELPSMMRVIGFIAFLAISIATLGLLGMVVFSTETRLREISIRKVFGASEGKLVVMMSRGFVWLIVTASAIAIPGVYYVFDNAIFARMAARPEIGFFDLFTGPLIVLGIAVIAISSQTLRVARVNPAVTLRNE